MLNTWQLYTYTHTYIYTYIYLWLEWIDVQVLILSIITYVTVTSITLQNFHRRVSDHVRDTRVRALLHGIDANDVVQGYIINSRPENARGC